MSCTAENVRAAKGPRSANCTILSYGENNAPAVVYGGTEVPAVRPPTEGLLNRSAIVIGDQPGPAALVGYFEVADLEDAPGGLVDQEAHFVAASSGSFDTLRRRDVPTPAQPELRSRVGRYVQLEYRAHSNLGLSRTATGCLAVLDQGLAAAGP